MAMSKPRVAAKSKPEPDPIERAEALFQRLRELCFGFPGVEEKLSHGSPAFFVRGKMFAMFANDGHRDGRVAVWFKAEHARQAALVAEDPARFFVPPYVGVKGWVGARLDREPDWEALTILIEDGWASVAPAAVASGPVLPAPTGVTLATTDKKVAAAALALVSAIAAELPESAAERDGWHTSFQVRGKSYAYVVDNHHGDGIVGVWLKMGKGENLAVVAHDPRRFFIPPYLGPRGWLGIRLDTPKIDWTDVADRLRAAHAAVAPKRPLKRDGTRRG
jgi:hypothetical protein